MYPLNNMFKNSVIYYEYNIRNDRKRKRMSISYVRQTPHIHDAPD